MCVLTGCRPEPLRPPRPDPETPWPEKLEEEVPEPSEKPDPPAGWVAVAAPDDRSEEFKRASQSVHTRVKLVGDRVRIERAVKLGRGECTQTEAPDRPPPFQMGCKYRKGIRTRKGRKAACMTHVRRVEDGWLGGAKDGLWFTADDGRNWRRLVLQEVNGLTTLGDNIVAITQDPTWGDWDPYQGMVYAVKRGAGGWKTVALVNLFSAPRRYLREPDGALLVLAAQGLARVQPGGTAQWVATAENADLYPCSMVRDGQGVIYVGMRGAVLRFIPVGQHYYADWLVPED